MIRQLDDRVDYMNFNGGGNVKFSGIKSYNTQAKSNTTFKKQFYDGF